MFRSRRLAILATCLLCGSCWAIALLGQEGVNETGTTIETLDGKVRQFLEGISAGETQSAYDELLINSRLASQEQALADLIDKTKQLDKFGEYRAFEQIAAKRLGKDLVLLKYLYKCEDFPVVWYFSFYRTSVAGATEPGKWRIITVRFDTNLERLAWGEGA